MTAQMTVTTARQPRASIEGKKQSYRDGYAHGLLGWAWQGQYAADSDIYTRGYTDGQRWLERNAA